MAESAGAGGEAARPDYVVDFWHTDQGLPHNTVNALLQTRDGYLWVGTAAGLARFDGLVFSGLAAEAAPALEEVPITVLLEDREGGLWIGTQGRGVTRYWQGRVQTLTTKQGLADDAVTSLAEDTAGVVWVGTQRGLSRWQQGRLQPFAAAAIPAGDNIIALHAGRSGTLWITTRSGVYQLQDDQVTPFRSDELPQGRNAELIGAYEDRSGNLWAFGATFLLNLTQGRRLNNPAPPELASLRVWTICEQGPGYFWIGTSGRGLFRFYNQRFESTGVLDGLDQCDVRALYADSWGNLWVGTSGNGLARLRSRRVSFVGSREGLGARKISALAADRGGRFWIGTVDAGLWQADGLRVQPFGGGPPLDRLTQIQSLCVDGAGALWAGSWGAGLFRLGGNQQQRWTTAEGLSDDAIGALAADGDGQGVWAGMHGGTLDHWRDGKWVSYGPGDGLTGKPILCLLSDRRWGLLVGSQAGGLAQWDGQRFLLVSGPRELKTFPIRCLSVDRTGRLWAGTWGAGAFCRMGEGWVPVSRHRGLGSDLVGQVTQDATGDYWFSTEENLFRVRAGEMEQLLGGTREAVACVPAMAEEGLEELKCSVGWPGAAWASNGVLWLAARTGLLPLATRGVGELPPPVILERVLVNGHPQGFNSRLPLRLGPGASSIDFVFTAVSFTAPHKVRFRHRLENFDRDWVQTDAARRAHYGPLPPGRYQFRVIAANADGVWNEAGATLALEVVPPLWRAWWFLSLCGGALVAGVWMVARLISTRRLEARLRAAEQEHAMERERTRIAQDMHDEIGSKLTRISFLSEVARQGAGPVSGGPAPVEAIANTSRELLQRLDEMVWAVNPRNDNLEQLAGYLEQHAREYFQATPLECQIQVPAQLPPAPLSAELRHNVFLAFEEALNNTLKHSQAVGVRIAMRLRPQAFEIEVRDNGRGFSPGPSPGFEQDGLRNMRTRLDAIGGECRVASQPGRGTTVTLHFPLPRETVSLEKAKPEVVL